MFDPLLDKYVGGLFSFVEQFINTLNDFLYLIFRFGNYILFVIFVVMAIVLYKSAREIEYRENIHGKIERKNLNRLLLHDEVDKYLKILIRYNTIQYNTMQCKKKYIN